MNRTTPIVSKKLNVLTQIITEILTRGSSRFNTTYQGKRNLYKALGYPEESELTFEYYYRKYKRNSVARAVIDRPCDATWKGDVGIVKPGENAEDSPLNKVWKQLNKDLKLKQRLNKVDKLCELGKYSLLLLGLDDVKKVSDFKREVGGGKRNLLYVKQISEKEGTVDTWDTNTNSPRYGLPLTYHIQTGKIQSSTSGAELLTQEVMDIVVHWTRVIHNITGNLTNEVYGASKLEPIINPLIDIEKILGGDAEMFWRGARPGYTATEKEDYQLSAPDAEALMQELDNYEHDLRRFITAKGVDIKALEQQVANPQEHLDVQLQVVSAQTSIPKRVLVGSERGELASSQDADAWLDLIKTRQEEHAEGTILRPLIDRLMEYKVLPAEEVYDVMWTDVFAPSEADKVEIGHKRSEALKNYTDSPLASDVITPNLVGKYLLGLNEEQAKEITDAMDMEAIDERKLEQDVPISETAVPVGK